MPPSVKQELGEDHLCFFIHHTVEHLDLNGFEQEYSEEGGVLYHPALMLKVWLYAYAVGITSARRLEQRIGEDLALRYLAGGARPDNWALSAFRRRHARGLNDVFTQVLEMARTLKLGRLGQVAIDSTRIQAAASRNRLETERRLRQERSRLRRAIRKWQKQCDGEDPNEGAGTDLKLEGLQQHLAEMPRRLEKLRKSGLKKMSRTDPEARFLRERGGFALGYTAEIAVNEDHLIVGQRVTQNAADNDSLIPLVEEAERQMGTKAEKVLADAGFFSLDNLEQLEARGLDVYLPDSNLARELNTGQRCARTRLSPRQRRMRQKLRSPAGRALYGKRKALVEPVLGSLKEQRGMRRFRLRGLKQVALEFTLAAISFNLTRLARMGSAQPADSQAEIPSLVQCCLVLTHTLKPAFLLVLGGAAEAAPFQSVLTLGRAPALLQRISVTGRSPVPSQLPRSPWQPWLARLRPAQIDFASMVVPWYIGTHGQRCPTRSGTGADRRTHGKKDSEGPQGVCRIPRHDSR